MRHAQVGSDAFRRWVKGTVAAASDGAPRELYHRSNIASEAVITGRHAPHGWMRMGAYIAATSVTGSRHSTDSGIVVPVFVSMKHPLDLRDAKPSSLVRAGLDVYGYIPKLKRQGFDGIVFTDELDGDTYVAFLPSQIQATTPAPVNAAAPNPRDAIAREDEVYSELPHP